MEDSNIFPAAIIEQESSAITNSSHFLTGIGFSDILISEEVIKLR